MKFRSHMPRTLYVAALKGKQIWALDTGEQGEDDTLIGTEAEVINDILHHHDLDHFPDTWSIDKLDNASVTAELKPPPWALAAINHKHTR